MVTIKELERSIAEEKKKLIAAKKKEILQIKESELGKELFRLKHRRAIASAGKAQRILKRAGIGLVKAGKKAIPIIQKQARLIRDQQLRDDAIARKIESRKPKEGNGTKTVTTLITVGKGKGKKKVKKIKVIKTKKKKSKKRKPSMKQKEGLGFDPLGNLDF